MRKLLLVVLCLVALSMTVAAVPMNDQAASEVIAVTKAQWAAENAGDIAAATKNIADDYTEFNGDYPTRLDGKGMSRQLSEANAAGSVKTVVSEMANPKVQVYGDVAILTYNYIGLLKDKDGKTEAAKAKSTRVYVKKDGQWMLVHANFAPAD